MISPIKQINQPKNQNVMANQYSKTNKTRHFSGEVSEESNQIVAFDQFIDPDPMPYSEVKRDLNAEHSMMFIGHKGMSDCVNLLIN